MTYRERRQAKADRLRQWAEGRDAKATAAGDKARSMLDMIPPGQPILVGHHSESRHRRDLDRLDRAMDNRAEHAKKADRFRSRADHIEAAADASIYSDDPDAIERMEARIASLEAERDRVKRFNATARKGTPDWSILTEQEAASFRSTIRVCPEQVTDAKGRFRGFPQYHLSNLAGNLKRQRDRLAQLRRRAENVAAAEAQDGVIVRRAGPDRVTVTFAAKPDQDVRSGLKAHGFRWVSAQGCWVGPDLSYAEQVARTHAADG